MSTEVLSAQLVNLGQSCSLPTRELLAGLTETELLDRYLQRHLYNALLDACSPSVPELSEEPDRRAVDGFSSWDEFSRWCESMELNSQSIWQFGPRLDALSEEIWGPMVASHFLNHRADYDSVVLNVVRITDPDLATELYFQLEEGQQDFSGLANHYGQAQDRAQGGRIGPVLVRQLNPLLERVVRRYNPLELIPPLDVNGNVHLMRIESLEPARLDEQLHRQIVQQLRHEWLQSQLELLRQRLKEWVLPPIPEQPEV
jgi:parvulin-like peptidyl-prolyl isomerase